jgi:PKD repeat protein
MRTIFTHLFLFASFFCLFGELEAQVVTTSVQISTSTDDAEERGLNGNSLGVMDLTSSDLELVRDGGDGDQFVGIRFDGLAIPQNVRITRAYVQFTVDETDNSDGTIFIQVEDTDNALPYADVIGNISSRALLNDTVTWAGIPEWTAEGNATEEQQTPDLSALVQSIVDRDGWAAGNALAFVLTGTGERTAEAYDGDATGAATLVVEYIEMVTATFFLGDGNNDVETNVGTGANDFGSSDIEITTENAPQVITLRYPNVTVPSGSEIASAYVQFTVDEAEAGGDVDVLILFESEGDAAPLTSEYSPEDPEFDYQVIWNNIPDWNTVGEAGPDQRTVDLSGSLQQVFGGENWRSGNSVLIGMIDPAILGVPGYTGNTSKRVAESFDGDGTGAQLVISFFPPTTFEDGGFPVVEGSSWKFFDKGIALDTVDWTGIDYDDSSWSFGDALLGYGGNGEVTTLDFGPDAQNKYPTYYLRHTFEVENAAQYDSLLFDVLRDDGAIVYLNGTEVFRQNMPAGDVTYADFANGAVGGADESIYYREKIGNLLVDGRNIIAVELHQATASSSDLSFDLVLDFTLPPLEPATFPLTRGSAWHYLDEGVSLDGQDWTDLAFATRDDAWLAGNGPLGYGVDVATDIRFGNDPENKFITTYFRREIDLDLTTLPDSVQLAIRRDDGAIVYLNGVEVMRSNMPAGDFDYQTLASSTASGSDEINYFGINLYPEDFRDGINTIAVEIHQATPNSTDLVFDLTLDTAPVVNPPGLGCLDGNGNHIACFTSIAPTAETTNMIIAGGSHRFQAIHKQGGTYSIGGGTIPGNHDFTGFVPLNGTSSTAGYLSINHENSPGGVSMLGLHYDEETLLWVVDSSQAVDFYNDDLVTTTRNCSGGITPWGTVITAEESLNNTDENSDGYTDVGWLVEIDPVTARVMEYGNGKQEKLWAIGRVSHENAVVLNDEKTLFTGEDGGSSAVFKFVADNPRDLTSGKLYALQLDLPLDGSADPTGTTGTWIEIPNTTPEDRSNTRSLAIALGATNFNGVEDIEFSPLTGQIYYTSKGFGRVYRFTDGEEGVTDFETFVGGTSYVLNTEDGVFTEPWRGGNDNLTFDDQGNLWVLQDGGLNYIWVVRADHTQTSPKVELFASMPIGSEPAGLTFTPDNKFGFFSVQHPSSGNQPQVDATGNEIAFNASTTVIFSRSEFLGAQPPAVAFEADRRLVIQGESVTFNDLSENGVTRRNWVFDGGVPAVSAEESVAVTYNGLGFYAVSLTVENSQGAAEVVETEYIEVIEPAPTTDFTANNIMVNTNSAVTFFDLSTNNPTSWSWTFEGGEPAISNEETPTVTYMEPGLYSVSLLTSNRAGDGTTEAKTEYIEVMRPVSNNDPVGRETNLAVYPNPTTGRINIRMEGTAGKQIAFELFDLTGRRVADLGIVNGIGGTGIWSYDLDEASTKAQVLVLKITLNGEATHRMIKLTR